MKLYPFQEQGVQFLLDGSNKLLADDMGLGKTIQSIEMMNRSFSKRVLIICPASVRINWGRELVQWLRLTRKIHIVFNGTAPIPHDADIIIVNYDLLAPVYSAEGKVLRQGVLKKLSNYIKVHENWDYLICDEAHYLKSPKSKRSRAVLGTYGLARKALNRVMLTGTPVLNRPKEIFIFLKTLAPELIEPYTDWMAFGQRYCGGASEEFNGSSNIEELNQRLQSFMLRRKKTDVLTQLPKKIIQHYYLDFVFDDSNIEIPYLPTIRRELGIQKVPYAVQHVKELLRTERKVVIFAHHREVIEGLETLLAEYNPVKLYGGLSSGAKQEAIDRFVEDETVRVFIGQFHSAGQGIDGLQKVCSLVVFVEMDWTPGIMDQATDRLVRIGQTESVLVHYLIVPNTLDDYMRSTLKEKRRVIRRLLHQELKEAPMSIELQLERLANAAEAIVELLSGAETLGGPSLSEDPKPKGKGKGKGKAAAPATLEDDSLNVGGGLDVEAPAKPAAAPAPDTSDLLGLPSAPAGSELTLNDVRIAATKYVNSSDDLDGNKGKARELFKKYGAEKLDDLPEESFADVVAALEKGTAKNQASKEIDL